MSTISKLRHKRLIKEKTLFHQGKRVYVLCFIYFAMQKEHLFGPALCCLGAGDASKSVGAVYCTRFFDDCMTRYPPEKVIRKVSNTVQPAAQ